MKSDIFKLITFSFLIWVFSIQSSFSFEFQNKECSNNYSALVFEDKTGNIIFENDADEYRYPASLTKLMTIYLAFEALKNGKLHFYQELTANDRDEDISSVNKVLTLNLKIGDKINVREAIDGVLVKSFNEAAVMLAEAISGSEWKFVELMNEKAKKFGMKYTNFRNASGLPDLGQFTTNYDLARMVMAIRRDFPEYYYFFSTKETTINGVKYKTHNNVLFEYKGAEGMKTGFTNAAGYNLIAVAMRNNYRVISVLTSCASSKKRDDFTKELLDYGFQLLSKKHDEIKIGITKKELEDKEMENAGLNKFITVYDD